MHAPHYNPTADENDTRSIGDFRLIRRLLGIAWEHKVAALPALLTTIALQLLTLAELAGQGLAIDLIRRQADPDAPPPEWPFGITPPEEWSFLQTIVILGVVVLLLSLLSGAARFGTRVCDELFVQSCIVDLRVRLYDKLQRLGFRYFDTHDTGQIINYVTSDAQSVRSFIQGVMIRLVIAAATLSVFLTYMLREHVWLTLACLTVIPVQVAVMVRYGRKTRPRFLTQARLVDRLVKRLAESIAGVRVIRAFGREKAQAAWFGEAATAAMEHRISIGVSQGVHIPVIQAGNILSLAVLIGVGGYLVMLGPAEGGLALGTLWIFRGLLGRLGSQAEAIVQVVASAPEALAGAQRVFNLIDEPVQIDSPENARAVDGVHGGIVFEHVSFRYAPDQPVVLEDISFEAKAGETVAIVGPTGSGKTTLLQLIARFHDPTEGRVLLDGEDLRTYDVETLRAGIGVVFQDPFLFSNTIGANVAFGRPDAGEDAVRDVAAAAAADGFIAEQDQAYDTIIGERGVSLSGGERQRLTIARALLVDPPVLLLDDPTGSVDAVTESQIQAALDDYRQRGSAKGSPRTTFIVAHRLSTLRRADRVIVLEGGRIAATGTHEALMEVDGHYRRAAELQLGR